MAVVFQKTEASYIRQLSATQRHGLVSRRQHSILDAVHHTRFVRQSPAKAVIAVLASRRDLALGDTRLEGARAHVELLRGTTRRGGRRGTDIKIEDVHRQAQRRARVGDVHDARHVALDGRARQQQVDLVVAVAEAAQVLDAAQRSLSIRDGDVHVVLLAVLVDGEALKVQRPAGRELGLHGAGDVDRRLEAQVGHTVLDHFEVDGDDAGHLDGAAEGNFAIALFSWG